MIRIGCSGWNYAHWRNGVFYPPRLPASKWLDFYAERFDTVEVNATFYRLPKREAVANWVAQIAARLPVRGQGKPLPDPHQAAARHGPGPRPLLRADRAAHPLAQARPGALAAPGQLQARRRAARGGARPPAARPPLLRVPARELVRRRDLRAAAEPRRRARDRRHARRGRSSRTSGRPTGRSCASTAAGAATAATTPRASSREWAERIDGWRERGDVFAYFNNDWEGFAPRNAIRLRELLGVELYADQVSEPSAATVESNA